MNGPIEGKWTVPVTLSLVGSYPYPNFDHSISDDWYLPLPSLLDNHRNLGLFTFVLIWRPTHSGTCILFEPTIHFWGPSNVVFQTVHFRRRSILWRFGQFTLTSTVHFLTLDRSLSSQPIGINLDDEFEPEITADQNHHELWKDIRLIIRRISRVVQVPMATRRLITAYWWTLSVQQCILQ